jgi:hypothetical protein
MPIAVQVKPEPNHNYAGPYEKASEDDDGDDIPTIK